MNLSGFHFQLWQWLLLIPLLWPYLAWWYQQSRNHRPSSINTSIVDMDMSSNKHFYHPLVGKLIEGSNAELHIQKPFWRKANYWWYSSIFSLLLLALAQPTLTGKRLPDPPPERDIVFLVDVSVSMQLADYQQEGKAVKRIDVLLKLLDEFATKMKGEKISVILFAEQAYVLVPLSSDQNLIQRMLKRIKTTLAGRYTAVGDALLMALNESLYINNNKPTEDQQKRHQTFILFTDADTSRGKVIATAAAKVISEHDIPVFTIAIGSSNSDMNTENIQGGLYQPVDLDLLDKIATLTKGQSYQVNDSEAMQKALHDVLKQRQNIATPKPKYEIHQLYFFPLLIALLLLVLFQIMQLAFEPLKTKKAKSHKMTKKGGGVLL